MFRYFGAFEFRTLLWMPKYLKLRKPFRNNNTNKMREKKFDLNEEQAIQHRTPENTYKMMPQKIINTCELNIIDEIRSNFSYYHIGRSLMLAMSSEYRFFASLSSLIPILTISNKYSRFMVWIHFHVECACACAPLDVWCNLKRNSVSRLQNQWHLFLFPNFWITFELHSGSVARRFDRCVCKIASSYECIWENCREESDCFVFLPFFCFVHTQSQMFELCEKHQIDSYRIHWKFYHFVNFNHSWTLFH